MHHTDYSSKLRIAKQKTVKKLASTAAFTDSVQGNTSNLLRAATAAVLILTAILQMDPANAEPTMDIAGYGSLQLHDSDRLSAADTSVQATVVSSDLKMIIEDDRLNMIIDQTFDNQSRKFQYGEYWLVLPKNAKIKFWSMQLALCGKKNNDDELTCRLQDNSAQKTTAFAATRSEDRIRIQTPMLAPNQRVKVRLDINYPNIPLHQRYTYSMPTATDEFDTNLVTSVVTASGMLGSFAAAHTYSTLQSIGTYSHLQE